MHPDDGRRAPSFDWTVVGLDRKPAELERRVTATLDHQLQTGLYAEVQLLDERYALAEQFERRGADAPNQVLHTHGYREFFEHARANGRAVAKLTKTDLSMVREAVLAHIVAYTRRQRSWFKKLDHCAPAERCRLCRVDRGPTPNVRSPLRTISTDADSWALELPLSD